MDSQVFRMEQYAVTLLSTLTEKAGRRRVTRLQTHCAVGPASPALLAACCHGWPGWPPAAA